MLKSTLTAIVVALAVLPGRMTATTTSSSFELTIAEFSCVEIDDHLAENIIRTACLRMNLNFLATLNRYNEGEITIERLPDSFALVEAQGGLTIAIIEEF